MTAPAAPRVSCVLEEVVLAAAVLYVAVKLVHAYPQQFGAAAVILVGGWLLSLVVRLDRRAVRADWEHEEDDARAAGRVLGSEDLL